MGDPFIDPAIAHPIFQSNPEPTQVIDTTEPVKPLIHQNWQPIDTAPHDGTIIIASGHYDEHQELVMPGMAVRFYEGTWQRDNAGRGMNSECYPRRWIPMPD